MLKLAYFLLAYWGFTASYVLWRNETWATENEKPVELIVSIVPLPRDQTDPVGFAPRKTHMPTASFFLQTPFATAHSCALP
jgi:hypothetical protein